MAVIDNMDYSSLSVYLTSKLAKTRAAKEARLASKTKKNDVVTPCDIEDASVFLDKFHNETKKIMDESPCELKIPSHNELSRLIPNVFARSKIFGILDKKVVSEGRRFIDNKLIYRNQNESIRYSGIQLDQNDLDVWLNLIHLSTVQNHTNQVTFTAYSMLKMLGKINGGKNVEILNSSLRRLNFSGVEIKHHDLVCTTTLIQDCSRDESSKEYVVTFNPKIANLFKLNSFTAIDLKIRSALHGKQLAQWLHGFYATHAEPYALKVETLLQLSGSKTKEVWRFKQSLLTALKQIASAYQQNGQSFVYEISENGLVTVQHTPTQSQLKHIKRRSTKAILK